MNFRYLLGLSLLLLSSISPAQDFVWLKNDSLGLNNSASFSGIPITVDDSGAVYRIRPVGSFFNYSQLSYGRFALEKFSPFGERYWSYEMGDSVAVRDIAVDDSGNVFVGGMFMMQFHSDGHVPTLNTNVIPTNDDMFLLKIKPDGTFGWIRNLSSNNVGLSVEELDAIEIDANGKCWYGYNNYQDVMLRRINVDGNDVQTIQLNGAKLLGDFTFDQNNNVIVGAAIGSGSLFIGINEYVNPFSYAYFIAKINSFGQSNWVNFYEDVTFQYPTVASDTSNNIYFATQLLIGINVGGTELFTPPFGSDFAFVKLDANGQVLWARDIPNQEGSGDFSLLSRNGMSNDANGNFWLGGSTRGSFLFFGGIPLGNDDPSNYDLGFLQYNSDGELLRTLHGGSNNYDLITGIVNDNFGNMYFTGIAKDTTHFGPVETIIGNQSQTFVGKWATDPFVGIEQPSNSKHYTLYPNPSLGELTLRSASVNAMIRLFDLQGRLVKEMSGASSYSLKELPSALYLVQIIEGNTISTSRWLKN